MDIWLLRCRSHVAMRFAGGLFNESIPMDSTGRGRFGTFCTPESEGVILSDSVVGFPRPIEACSADLRIEFQSCSGLSQVTVLIVLLRVWATPCAAQVLKVDAGPSTLLQGILDVRPVPH